MEDLAARLAQLEELAAGIAAEIVGECALRGVDEATLVGVLSSAARVQRCLEAASIEAVAEVVERSDSPSTEGRMTHRFGCRTVAELVQRTTLGAPASASRLVKAAAAVHRGQSVTTGEMLEAPLPSLRDALCDGIVGVDGVLAIAAPLLAMGSRAERGAVLTADAVLAAEARGTGPDAAPPACADLLRVQAQAWAMALDPDGAEPRGARAIHKRGLTFGTAVDDIVPVRGGLLVEVAAQFQRQCDAVLSPRGAGVRFDDGEIDPDADHVPADSRTRAQQQHDVFAMLLSVAASSEVLPTIGGAAPTLVVSAREEDLISRTGYAHVEGADEPVAIAAALHIACAGAVQRVVLSADGRVRSLGTPERVFNKHQRRAIALRDGGCIIPGCRVPAGWCEIHHVTEYAIGGPTHTDNGVLLCWYHHRFLDRSGWSVRMNRGVPEVRAPGWCDATRAWRAVTRSKTRLLNAVLRR